MTDRLTGLLGLVLALAYAVVGSGFESDFITDPLGPNTYPVLLGIALGVCSLILVVRSRARVAWPDAAGWLRNGAAVAAMVVYGLLLEQIGFLLASALLVATLVLIMAGGRKQAVVVGVGASVALYVLFDVLLGLPLPTGAIAEALLGG